MKPEIDMGNRGGLSIQILGADLTDSDQKLVVWLVEVVFDNIFPKNSGSISRYRDGGIRVGKQMHDLTNYS